MCRTKAKYLLFFSYQDRYESTDIPRLKLKTTALHREQKQRWIALPLVAPPALFRHVAVARAKLSFNWMFCQDNVNVTQQLEDLSRDGSDWSDRRCHA